jgi:hypothetical protein
LTVITVSTAIFDVQSETSVEDLERGPVKRAKSLFLNPVRDHPPQQVSREGVLGELRQLEILSASLARWRHMHLLPEKTLVT